MQPAMLLIPSNPLHPQNFKELFLPFQVHHFTTKQNDLKFTFFPAKINLCASIITQLISSENFDSLLLIDFFFPPVTTMKSVFLAILLSVAFVACQFGTGDDGYEPPPSIDVSISYVNEEGVDLLDPQAHDASFYNHFNVFYLQLNEATGELEQVEANPKTQYSFYTDESTGRVALRVFPNREFIDGYSKTLIESPRDDFDTLRVKGHKEGRGAIAERVWYNGTMVWETADPEPRRFFTIIKSSL